MPRSIAYRAEVEYWQILSPDGTLDEEMAEGTLSAEDVRGLYELMVIFREFDETAFRLQRSGRMGTYPQNRGEEAVSLGAARALRKGQDWIVPYYRENAALFHHGLPMHQLLLHWMGDERANAIGRELCMNPMSVAIGTQTLHATGLAWGFKMRREDRVVLVFFGDGATSTGDVHEAMNFAALFKTPTVFSCVNNGFAISVPCCRQTNSETFAQKALAYGMPTVRVDGNDIFATYKAHRDAAERARRGEGPSFVESVTYRLGDHTTADDARRYRPAEEVEAAAKLDPLRRTRRFLERREMWDDERQRVLEARAKAIVDEVVHAALAVGKPAVEDLFNYTFAELPTDLARQRDTGQTHSLGMEPGQETLRPVASRPAEMNGHREPGRASEKAAERAPVPEEEASHA